MFIGIGTNLGDRVVNITFALRELNNHPTIQVEVVSSIYETEPIGNLSQPMFLNAAVRISTTLEPTELLAALIEIEAKQGRVRTEKWGPRSLDLDILLFGSLIVRDKNLVVPHQYLTERDFVLIPLYEIAPNLELPASIGSLRNLLYNRPNNANIKPIAVVKSTNGQFTVLPI